MNIKVEVKPYHIYEILLTARYSETEEILWCAQAPSANSLSFWDGTKKYEDASMQLVLKNISKDLCKALDDQESV